MLSSKFCQLWLTCADEKEADKIGNTLLVKHLVACVKQVPITSDFRWQGKIENAKEVLLVMDSRIDLFEEIEKEIAALHSYDTFVLQAVPIARVSRQAEKWLANEVKT